ncbi:hypothetical protein [Flavobacterium sp. IMCC34518]|uniref:hypothetical protein n=1 Tax=Flavobacterium sp. IMCC34518 TaxID=3003623 RepID=UPI0022AC3D08|nr:hypothetical protein [Flavobacterium sp. IMCC34518]
MKKIIVLLCFITSSITFVSCTNDDLESTTTPSKQQLTADSDLGGNSTGQTPTTPPKK